MPQQNSQRKPPLSAPLFPQIHVSPPLLITDIGNMTRLSEPYSAETIFRLNHQSL